MSKNDASRQSIMPLILILLSSQSNPGFLSWTCHRNVEALWISCLATCVPKNWWKIDWDCPYLLSFHYLFFEACLRNDSLIAFFKILSPFLCLVLPTHKVPNDTFRSSVASKLIMAYQPLDQNITDFTNKRHTKETGWGLYASKDIAAGQKIISILRPLVISLDIPRLKDTCYSCLNYTNEVHHAIRSLAWHEDRKLQICTGCHVVRYCSKVSTKLRTV